MTIQMPPTVAALGLRPEAPADTATMASIHHRWSRLVDAEVQDLKTLENLAAAINSTYGYGANQAAAQVQEWVAGRVLLRADIERGQATSTPIDARMMRAAALSWARDEVGPWH